MPDSKKIEQRQEDAFQRIAKALGVEPWEIRGDAPGNPPLARAMEMEKIADAVGKFAKGKPAVLPSGAVGAVTVETQQPSGEKSVETMAAGKAKG